jgi:hypothetical protein
VQTFEALKASDAAVVARFLQIRSVLHNRHLARIDRLVQERYVVEPTRRIHPTLMAHVRTGYVRPGEGELWPVVFLTPVDILLGLCVELSPERVSGLGTMINGPTRMRQRQWEEWWGWEKSLAALHPEFFEMALAQQEEVIVGWYSGCLEWLTGSGLLRQKP